ncbi:uncharacterized protein EI97DRAFT_430559 [Westerdykella ornata]|uniref:Uncharacterized protein n=1 Tax=Westerdykella ornata TaxID=318751 RepID=A0A6A6JTR3_WESOR|nr:uncharacterized protein EI97DRAFT_430559 [Westerdykella ornata]KAF2279493.1 hypothetical protein EI97DRAFT_430559 [Westerdykella ornata]
MAIGWNIAALLKLALSCFVEVAFFWQLVSNPCPPQLLPTLSFCPRSSMRSIYIC